MWLDEQSSRRLAIVETLECTFHGMSKGRLTVGKGGGKLPYLVFLVLLLAGLFRLFLICVWRGLYCCICIQ